MKYCPQCNKQYSEPWLTFCTDDGSLLHDDLTPARDPNWDPRIRETQVDDRSTADRSEFATQWLPRDPPPTSGWMAPDAPDYRGPVVRPWQPPPSPAQPQVRSTGPPGAAVASFVIGLVAIMIGLFCGVPIPGLIAVILGIVALTQMKQAPSPAGRGLAIAGIVMGSINLAFFLFRMLWFILSLAFG